MDAQYEGEFEDLSGVMSPLRLLDPFHIADFAAVPQKRQELQHSPRKTNHEQYQSFNPSSKHHFAFSVGLYKDDSFLDKLHWQSRYPP